MADIMNGTAEVSTTAGGSRGSSPPASTAGGSGGSSPLASTTGGSGGSSPPASTAGSDARSRGDTRARIQQVAIELFTEHGYEGTSLREIAERLDVTKAALYYHFKSKEDIVRSLVEDYFGQIDALITWGKAQPRTDEVRREILCRYVGIVAEGDRAFRLLHQNQAAVNTMASAKSRGELFKERMHSLVELLTDQDAPLPERVRAAMTLGGISVGWMFFADQVADRREFSDLVRSLACDFAKVTD